MKEETTGRLESLLKEVDSLEKAKDFAEKHGKEPQFFYGYINEYIGQHKLDLGEVISKSGISKNYIYNILNGKTKLPGRDKIIALCIAAGMTVEEVNRGLKIAGHNGLYPKNKRDILISALINQGMTDVTSINLKLEKEGEAIIEV